MLVSVNDLTVFMDVQFSMRQQDAAEFVLEGLQGELEAYLRRPVEPTEFEEDYRIESQFTGIPMSTFLSGNTYGSYGDSWPGDYPASTATSHSMPPQTLYLRNTPVVSVEEVSIKPVMSASVIVLVDEQDYMVRKFGIDIFNASADDLVTVKYHAGIDGSALPLFKLMILRAATREMQNMHDDVVGVKDLNARNVATLDVGFTDRELLSVKRYKRVRVA